MRKIKIKHLFIFTLTSLLTACGTTTHHEIDPTNLYELENVQEAPITTTTEPSAAPGLSQLRVKALQDTAMSLAAQAGLASSSKEINTHLEHEKWYLETTYNFNGMMLTHGVLPPVLVEGNNSLNLADPDTIRVADKTYKIIAQARFATTPPNWRDYLMMSYTKPEMPPKFLLPRDCEERKVWAKYVRIGWEKGMIQSYNIFQQNLARLKRDYNGMILYRKLLQEKMISAPFVSRTELGVTGDGQDMRINDQVLRITELPKLQTDSKDWRAIVVEQKNEY